jgi:FG-GAP repeat
MRSVTWRRAFAVFASTAMGLHSAGANGTGPAVTQSQFVASDGVPGDGLGVSVSISGDTAIAGAPGRAGGGAAYVFVRSGSTWAQQQELPAPVGISGFGYWVGVSGDTTIVAADGAGVAHAFVYVRTGSIWSLQQELQPPPPPAELNGFRVGVNGNTAILAVQSMGGGSVYVYVRQAPGAAWSLQQVLQSLDGNASTFGFSVALSGDTALVGAARTVYVFARSGGAWSLQQKLFALDGAQGDGFGLSLALSGDTAVVGAYTHGAVTFPGVGGAAYVFVRSGAIWSLQQELPDPMGGMGFGSGVAVDGDMAVIAAEQSGAVYTYARSGSTWSQEQVVTRPTGEDFGEFAAASGSTAVIGAPGHANFTGAAYVLAPPPAVAVPALGDEIVLLAALLLLAGVLAPRCRGWKRWADSARRRLPRDRN